MQDTYAVLPEAGQAQLRIFNGLNCRVPIDISGVEGSTIEPLSFWQAPTLSVNDVNTYNISVNRDSTCEEYPAFHGSVEVTEEQVTFNELWYDYGTKLTLLLIHLRMTRIMCVCTWMHVCRGPCACVQHQKVMKVY